MTNKYLLFRDLDGLYSIDLMKVPMCLKLHLQNNVTAMAQFLKDCKYFSCPKWSVIQELFVTLHLDRYL